MRQGHMIVIVAPSGTGKSTLIKRLKADFSRFQESISCTTRAMREGEVHGKNYFFLSKEEFKKRIDENEFLEWAIVHDNYYGTSKKFVEDNLMAGTDMLFDVDVQGADAIKACFGARAKVIFIEPPSIEELRHRLEIRGTDSREVIERRLKNAEKELLRKDDYDFRVLNMELEKAYLDLKSVVEKIISDQT